MYTVNGIDLSSGEFELLEKLVAVSDDPEAVRATLQHELEADPRLLPCAQELVTTRLIEGVKAPGYVYVQDVNRSGIDFVHDYYAMEKAKSDKEKLNKRHDYKVALYGAISGGVLGLFSGALGGYLAQWIASLF